MLRKNRFLAKNLTGGGYLLKPSQISDVDLKRMAGTANRRLYELEKQGLQHESDMYSTVEHYAVDKSSNLYNVKQQKGTIRFRTDVDKMDSKTRAEYVNTLRGFLGSKTGTASGTKRTQRKRFETFKKNLDDESETANDLTQEEYAKVWKAYRQNVKLDKGEHYGSDVVVQLIEDTNLAKLSKSDLDKAMKILNQADRAEDAYTQIINENPFIVQDI